MNPHTIQDTTMATKTSEQIDMLLKFMKESEQKIEKKLLRKEEKKVHQEEKRIRREEKRICREEEIIRREEERISREEKEKLRREEEEEEKLHREEAANREKQFLALFKVLQLPNSNAESTNFANRLENFSHDPDSRCTFTL